MATATTTGAAETITSTTTGKGPIEATSDSRATVTATRTNDHTGRTSGNSAHSKTVMFRVDVTITKTEEVSSFTATEATTAARTINEAAEATTTGTKIARQGTEQHHRSIIDRGLSMTRQMVSLIQVTIMQIM